MRCSILLLSVFSAAVFAQDRPEIDSVSGLYKDKQWQLVVANCGGCHSTKLVSQNRMSSANWVNTIRWMQEKQGMWALGENEQKIVSYLSRNYGIPNLPQRRKPLVLPDPHIEPAGFDSISKTLKTL